MSKIGMATWRKRRLDVVCRVADKTVVIIVAAGKGDAMKSAVAYRKSPRR